MRRAEFSMARTKKKFSAVTQVKAMARAAVGSPPAAKVLKDKKKRAADKHAKYKPTLGKMLAEDS